MHKEARIANYTLATLSVVCLVLMSLPLARPVQSLKACLIYLFDPIAYNGAKATQQLGDVPAHVSRLIAADAENALMREEITKAAWTQNENEALRLENQRLRAALALKPAGRRSAVWAHVMERDPLHWYRSLMIDAGLDQGLTLNSPVLGKVPGGRLAALGRVVEVRARSSVVLLITDELSSLASFVTEPAKAPEVEASSEAVAAVEPELKFHEGLLQGQGSARLRMNYLSPDARIAKGDLVLTSPTSATFPPDVLVGSVETVNPLDPFLTFQSVEVRPALDPTEVKEVMILKAEEGKLEKPRPETASARPAGEGAP